MVEICINFGDGTMLICVNNEYKIVNCEEFYNRKGAK